MDVFIPMTLLGCQLDLILNTYIGISVREINDRIAASADGGGADEAQSLGNGTTGSNSSASVSPLRGSSHPDFAIASDCSLYPHVLLHHVIRPSCFKETCSGGAAKI